jgi:hypothetical protein
VCLIDDSRVVKYGGAATPSTYNYHTELEKHPEAKLAFWKSLLHDNKEQNTKGEENG